MVYVTPDSPVSLSPDSTIVHANTVLRDALVNYVGTLVGQDEYDDRMKLRIPYTDPATFDTVSFVDEGAEIPEDTTTLKELEIPSRKLATLKVVSNESTRNAQGQTTVDLLTSQMSASIIAKADAALFGMAEEKGLTGLSALEGVTEGGELSSNLDPFIDALATIVSNGGDEAQARIVCHPKAWATIAKIKDTANGNRPLVDAITATSPFLVPNADPTVPGEVPTISVRTLNGVPMFISRHVAEKTVLVLDAPNVAVGASPTRFDTSEHAEFSRDSLAMRSTFRLGWKVFDPARIVKITTTEPAA